MARVPPSQNYPRFTPEHGATVNEEKTAGDDQTMRREQTQTRGQALPDDRHTHHHTDRHTGHHTDRRADRRTDPRIASDLPVKLRIAPTGHPQAPARYIPGHLINLSSTGTLIEINLTSAITNPQLDQDRQRATYTLAIARDPQTPILAHSDMTPVQILRSARTQNKQILALRFLPASASSAHTTQSQNTAA